MKKIAIEVSHIKSKTNSRFIHAEYLPEMRKIASVYKLVLKLDSSSYEIDAVVCGCFPGRCPRTICKHIVAWYYAVKEFGRP